MAFLDHIEICNRHDLAGFRPLAATSQAIGYVAGGLADIILGHGAVIQANGDGLRLDARLNNFAARSAAIAGLVRDLAAAGHIPNLRDELYPVAAAYADTALFAIDRAAVPSFGIRGYGVHINGFQRSADGAIHMWIGRRGAAQILCPGMLDNIAEIVLETTQFKFNCPLAIIDFLIRHELIGPVDAVHAALVKGLRQSL